MRGALSGRGLRRRRLRHILLLPVSVSACLPGRAGIERILITQRLIGRLGLRACGRRRARARAGRVEASSPPAPLFGRRAAWALAPTPRQIRFGTCRHALPHSEASSAGPPAADTGPPNLAQFGAIGPGQGTLSARLQALAFCLRARTTFARVQAHAFCSRASAAFVCVQAPPLFACKRRLCLRASARRGWQHRSQNLLFSLFALSPPGKSWGASRRPRPRALEPKQGKERSNGNHTRERSHPAIGA